MYSLIINQVGFCGQGLHVGVFEAPFTELIKGVVPETGGSGSRTVNVSTWFCLAQSLTMTGKSSYFVK